MMIAVEIRSCCCYCLGLVMLEKVSFSSSFEIHHRLQHIASKTNYFNDKFHFSVSIHDSCVHVRLNIQNLKFFVHMPNNCLAFKNSRKSNMMTMKNQKKNSLNEKMPNKSLKRRGAENSKKPIKIQISPLYLVVTSATSAFSITSNCFEYYEILTMYINDCLLTFPNDKNKKLLKFEKQIIKTFPFRFSSHHS